MRVIYAILILLLSCQSHSTVNSDGLIILAADQNDGHSAAWESRPYYFKRTWGIRGSGYPESGEIWFNKFPGESGLYEVYLDGILEQDGSSSFAVYADENLLHKGKFPYPLGKRDCDARGRVGEIPLGTHRIKKNQKIKIWARSVYECGKKGAYALWYSIRFVRVTPEVKSMD